MCTSCVPFTIFIVVSLYIFSGCRNCQRNWVSRWKNARWAAGETTWKKKKRNENVEPNGTTQGWWRTKTRAARAKWMKLKWMATRKKDWKTKTKMQRNLWDAIRDTLTSASTTHMHANNFAFILMNIFSSCSSMRNRLINVCWEHRAHAWGHAQAAAPAPVCVFHT